MIATMLAFVHFVPVLFGGLLVVVSLYVLLWGHPPERAGMLVIVAGSALSWLAADYDRLWRAGETGIFVVDIGALLAFIMLLAKTDRFWPMWVTAFQIIAVATHVARFASPRTVPMAYAVAEQFWVYPMMAMLVAATIDQRHRLIRTR